MTKIKNVRELRKAIAGGQHEFRILLQGGLYSWKTITPCAGRFDVVNHIDETLQRLTGRQLYTRSNIGEAMRSGTFVAVMPDDYSVPSSIDDKQPSAAFADTKAGLSFESRCFGTANVVTGTYRTGGALSVELVDGSGESIAVLSVNLPERSHLLGDGEFFAKTWSENREIAEDALASGIFRDTGRTSGDIVDAHIWKMR